MSSTAKRRSSIELSTPDNKKIKAYWSQEDSLLLVKLYLENTYVFNGNLEKAKRREAWKHITWSVNECCTPLRTVEQVMKRWQKIVAKTKWKLRQQKKHASDYGSYVLIFGNKIISFLDGERPADSLDAIDVLVTEVLSMPNCSVSGIPGAKDIVDDAMEDLIREVVEAELAHQEPAEPGTAEQAHQEPEPCQLFAEPSQDLDANETAPPVDDGIIIVIEEEETCLRRERIIEEEEMRLKRERIEEEEMCLRRERIIEEEETRLRRERIEEEETCLRRESKELQVLAHRALKAQVEAARERTELAKEKIKLQSLRVSIAKEKSMMYKSKMYYNEWKIKLLMSS
ncbi:hypothetical protein GWK47_041023 [Chionoecetes opilio]|uniref:Regulatory protein zeste n=1 Tax=Chionoecetes opilio TaxID=41210 RepID=A0A8J5CX29_CHIOP|nr:hypothetical protein GWK47_041023 [Chionoecetes opilio]